MKITKGAANYRKADILGEYCGNCKFFVRREGHDSGWCTLVEGEIERRDTCNLWQGVVPAAVKVGSVLVALLAAWLLAKRPRL